VARTAADCLTDVLAALVAVDAAGVVVAVVVAAVVVAAVVLVALMSAAGPLPAALVLPHHDL
jgi:hypothetical protein